MLRFGNPKDLKDKTVMKQGILYYTGRIMNSQQIECPEDPFFDIEPLSFVKPIVDRYSPVAYAIMLHSHVRLARHKGISYTLRESRSVAYVTRGRDLSKEIDENCRPCKRFKSRLVKAEMGNLHQTRLTIAPPFYTSQVDLFGPMDAQCEHNHRAHIKVYGCVFKCPSTSAIAIHAMQAYSTAAFLQAYTRFASRYGHPNHLAIDQGSQLVAACNKMEISIIDIKNDLHSKYQVGISYSTCSVSGHNEHGQVERSIKEVKNLIERTHRGLKLDLLSIETCLQWVAAELNNLPVAIGSRTEDLEYADIITPSRILLGRNSRRAMGAYARVNCPSRLIKQMDAVYEAWWRAWERQMLQEFIPSPPKWGKTTQHVKVGDIVIYLKELPEQNFGEPVWKIGRIIELVTSEDGISRVAIVQYKNANEKVFRTTKRSVRSMAIVYTETELDIVQQVEQASQESRRCEYQEAPIKRDQKLHLTNHSLVNAPGFADGQVPPPDIDLADLFHLHNCCTLDHPADRVPLLIDKDSE